MLDTAEKNAGKMASSQPDAPRLGLKRLANYALRGFVPVVSVTALAVAVTAWVGNVSNKTQESKAAVNMEALNSTVAALKDELAKLKAEMAQEKSVGKIAGEETSGILDERITKIVGSVTQLQIKAKITPTLQEQMTDGVLAAPTVANTTPYGSAAVSGGGKKSDAQLQAIKDAIEKFNKH